MKYARVGAALAVFAVVASACGGSSSSPSAAASGAAGGATINIKVGIELPMTGGEAPNGVPTANGVALALSQTSVTGFTITILSLIHI